MSKIGDLMTGVAAGAVGDVASLVTGGIGSGMSARKAEKLAKAQYQRQLEFWNMQNQYNLPINQKQRLKDAGLSVGLMYEGAGNASNAGELSNVAGDPSAGKFSPRSGFMDNMLAAQRMMAEIDEIKSRENLNNAQAQSVSGKLPYEIESMDSQRRLNEIYGDNAKIQATGMELDNSFKRAMNPVSVEQAKQNFQQGVYLLERYAWESDKAMTDARFARKTYDTRAELVEVDKLERLTQVALMGVQMEAAKKGMQLTEAQIKDFRSKLLGNVASSYDKYIGAYNRGIYGITNGGLWSNLFGLGASVSSRFGYNFREAWKGLFGSSAPESVSDPIYNLLDDIQRK